MTSADAPAPDPWRLTPPAAAPVPLLVDLPHSGTYLPPAVAEGMTDAGRLVADTDWHLQRIYCEIVPDLGGTLLEATHSRYVVDLNRPADGAPLYPGRDETANVPRTSFAGEPLYRHGYEPDVHEVFRRVATWWRPYRDELSRQLRSLVDRFGFALLWDGHSIRGEVPRFAAGRLPDLMLGDVDGTSCPGPVSDAVLEALKQAWSAPDAVVRNHVFRGGHITRAHGRVEGPVYALQLEMSQRIYMDESPPFAFDEARAPAVAAAIAQGLRAFVEAARSARS